MAKSASCHWVTFSDSQSIEELNALWFYLSAGGGGLKTVSLLQHSNAAGVEEAQTLKRIERFLRVYQSTAAIQIVRSDFNNPSAFAEAFTSLLAHNDKPGERTIIDVSGCLPSFIPVIAAQIVRDRSDVSILFLHQTESAFCATPFPLAPRPCLQLFELRDGSTKPLRLPETSQSTMARADIRQPWFIESNRLMLLVNTLCSLGYDRNIEIRLPLLKDLTLCRLHFGKEKVTCSRFIQEKEYQNRLHQVLRPLSPQAKKQIPAYTEIVQLFYAAGAMKPSGLDRLHEEFQRIGTRPLDQGGDVYHIALDTNLLWDRFFSNCLKDLSLPPNIDFVLCETVRSELMNRQDKIDKALIDGLAPLGRDLMNELFFNQNQIDDRLRYIGLQEYNRMRAETGCREEDARSTLSSAQNDRYILDAYSGFVEVGCKVLFISRDQETVRMMRGEEGVLSFLLKRRESLEEASSLEWKVLTTWLYLLSVAFGRLEWFVGDTLVARVDGVWMGKTVTQWEEDYVRLKLVQPKSDQDMDDYLNLKKSIHQGQESLRVFSV